ncbi:MAG: LemA family protein [Myxococcales bacterium]|nr:LemA family protein [Myxococcales bacterium]MCB9543711.1 LemA family protein [Myxococcales bacterium]
MNEPREQRGVRARDLDDVIEIAARRAEQRQDEVSRDEIAAIARELDIPDADVDAALHELRRRRAAEAAAQGVARAERRARGHRLKQITIAAAVILAALLGWSYAALNGRLADVERQRSQVYNVIERQAAVEAQWRDRPPSAARDAELSGAENRVRIERRAYDDAVTAYNTAAHGFPAVVFRGLLGYPGPQPLSAAVDWTTKP